MEAYFCVVVASILEPVDECKNSIAIESFLSNSFFR